MEMKTYTLGRQSCKTTATAKRGMNAFLVLVTPISSGAATSAHRSLKSAGSTDAPRVGKMQRCRRAQRLDPLRFHFQLVWLRSNWLKGLRWHIHSVQIYFSPRSHVRSRWCCVHGRGVGAWGSTRDFTAERSKSFQRCPATATEGEL